MDDWRLQGDIYAEPRRLDGTKNDGRHKRLLSQPTEFWGNGQFWGKAGWRGIGDNMERMIFDEVVYMDALTKSSLLLAGRHVRNATILVRTIISRRFNEAPPPEPERLPMGFQPPSQEST